MRAILIIMVLWSYTLTGWSQQNINGSFVHAGQTRNYTIHVPTNYTSTTSTPLVLNLHGYGSNRSEQALVSEMNTISDANNFIVVYPDGTLDLTGNRYWNANYNTFQDDIGFLLALVDTLKANYNINANRVYSTGYSNGAIMSHTLACEATNTFAAIASVAGTMAIGQNNSCSPTRPMPILHIHGTNDGVVPYNGNSLLIAVDTLIDYWVNFNGVVGTPTVNSIPDINSFDLCTADRFEYNGNGTQAPVHLIKVTGGRHTWPGSTIQTGGGTSQDFEASAVIWDFFDSNPSVTSIAEPQKINDFIKLEKNPVAHSLRWTSQASFYTISVVNGLGQIVLQQSIDQKGEQTIHISSLPVGVYFAVFQTAQNQQTIPFICNQK